MIGLVTGPAEVGLVRPAAIGLVEGAAEVGIVGGQTAIGFIKGPAEVGLVREMGEGLIRGPGDVGLVRGVAAVSLVVGTAVVGSIGRSEEVGLIVGPKEMSVGLISEVTEPGSKAEGTVGAKCYAGKKGHQ